MPKEPSWQKPSPLIFKSTRRYAAVDFELDMLCDMAGEYIKIKPAKRSGCGD
jgi:hypothetical protein